MTKIKPIPRFALVLAIPILCFLSAFAGYWLPDGNHSNIVTFSAFPISIAILVTIIISAQKAIRSDCSPQSLKSRLPLFLLSLTLVILYNLVDHRSEKVVFDELIIQSSAMQLLHTNLYQVPEFSHNLNDKFSIFASSPDKRPPLYPVLLSLVHRLRGYSQQNGYLLNSLLGIGLFFIIGNIGRELNHRYGEFLLVLVFASLPLLSQNITGQHFEILYLLLIACLFWISLRIACHEKVQEIPLAYLVAAAISVTRYEGIMFLMVPFFLHVYTVWKAGNVKGITPVLIICPIVSFFIFSLFGHMESRSGYWQLDLLESEQAFGIQFWRSNLTAFQDFLLNANREQPGSMALAFLGLASIPVVGMEILESIRAIIKKREAIPAPGAPLLLFVICALLYMGLFFSYHWGWVNSPETARFMFFPLFLLATFIVLALVKNPFFTLLIGSLVAFFFGLTNILTSNSVYPISYLFVLFSFIVGMVLVKRKVNRFSNYLLGFWILYLIIETFPAIQQARYERNTIPAKTIEQFHKWVDKYGDSNSVFISKTQTLGIIHQESSTSLLRFRDNPDALRDLQERYLFTDIFVLQAVEMDGSQYGSPPKEYEIPAGMEWELVEFKRINDNFGARMVKIVSWGNDDAS